jgi:hypothetical protein
VLLEEQRDVDAHEWRAADEARSDRDLQAPTPQGELGGFDAPPHAVFFAHEMLGEVLHGPFLWTLAAELGLAAAVFKALENAASGP